MSFLEFLQWVGTSEGIHAGIGFTLSFVIEWLPGYQQLEAKVKRLAFLGMCLVIPLLAATLQVVFGYTQASWEGLFWPSILAGAIAFGTGQMAHLRKLK